MSLNSCFILCRWLHFAALMTLVGAGSFTVLLAPQRYRLHLGQRLSPLLGVASTLTLVTALLLLSIQVGIMGNGWADIKNSELWAAVLDTHVGRAWQWQCGLALCAWLALLLPGAARQRVLLLCALVQLIGLALVGHAAMLNGWAGVFQRGNQMVHLLAAAFWVGGLVPMVLLMRDAGGEAQRNDAIHTMMRFSRYGHLAVALVLLSGVINTRLLLGWPLQHFGYYSQLLLLKVLLVAAMIGIALYNRYWLVPRFQRSESGAQRRFISTTLVEVAQAGLVLLLVSLFATLAPE